MMRLILLLVASILALLEGVNLVRQYKQKLKSKLTNLEFAEKWFAQPLENRFQWLNDLISESLEPASMITEAVELGNLAEEIENWGKKKLRWKV